MRLARLDRQRSDTVAQRSRLSSTPHRCPDNASVTPALLGLMVVVELTHLLRRSVHRRGSTRAFVRLRAAGSTVRRCDLARLAEPSEILAQRTEPHRGPSLIDTVGLFEVSWKGDTVTDRHRDAPRARSHSISGSACHDFGTGVHFTDVTFEEFAGSEVSG